MVLIFHHTDMDGYSSAAVIKKYNNKCYCRPVNYKDALPTLEEVEKANNISKVNVIYIVDYSFTEDTFYQLQDLLEEYKVIWIDHHKSSLSILPYLDSYDNLEYYIDTEYCGAINTWKYINDEKEIPYCLQLVDSWDTWKHFDENDFAFKLFFDSKKVKDTIEIFMDLIDTDNCDKYITHGKILENYTLNLYNQMSNKAYGAYLNGLNCIVLNTPIKSSLVFGNKIIDYDAAIVWNYDGSLYEYSIYTAKNIDVSTIAEIYGGGGHPSAAGFTSEYKLL